MKNSDQRLFIVVLFFSCICVHAAHTMSVLVSQEEQTAQTPDLTIQQQLSLLHVDIPSRPIKKSTPLAIKQSRSTESPVSLRYSASWPDFQNEYGSEALVDRRLSGPESKSAHPVERKEPRTLENFVYKANDVEEFVKILHRNPKRLQYFLEKLTPQMLDLLLTAYSSDFLYHCIRDKIILEAIDRAIRHNKFMSGSEPCSLKIVLPPEPTAAECDFDELVGDVTVLMLLAQRGLTGLIQLCFANKYIKFLHVINDEKMTAFDYANKAYKRADVMKDAHGLTSDQKIRYRHEFSRLEECVTFLSNQRALTGEEVFPAKNTIRRNMNAWALQRTIQKRALARSMKQLEIQDEHS